MDECSWNQRVFIWTRRNDRVQIKRLRYKSVYDTRLVKSSAINRVYCRSYHANTNPLVCGTMFDIFTSWMMSYIVELRFKHSVLLGRITVVDVKCFFFFYRLFSVCIIRRMRIVCIYYIGRCTRRTERSVSIDGESLCSL